MCVCVRARMCLHASMSAVCICVFVASCTRVIFSNVFSSRWVALALNFCQRQSQNPAHTVTGPDLASLTTTIHSPVQWLGFLSHRSGTPSDTPPPPRFRDVAIAGAEVIFQIWNGGFHGRCFIRKEEKKSPQELHSVGGVIIHCNFL